MWAVSHRLRRSSEHQGVRWAEPSALVKRDGPLGWAQHHASEVVLIGVAEQCAEKIAADAAIAVRGKDERVAQVTPPAWRASRTRHSLEDGQVHHADRAAAGLCQPGDPA